ncbi:hypothetical protein DYD83_12505 [Dickeya fangzhongdai]|uniref:Uncharacterized protein n=1 Tax=Dickeya fangzhongdai TaxID=1778540 RepID=A0A2K8QNR7_9GAMM|nr:hypothetical protein CVE23_12440 [Dickeya fangzhongdai]QOH48156.1 hypothetical protein DYD82_12505 [Dickeya fangzhongdai]QOH52458.1 hypothetical protein DYD83_12505 [Dickeya fangzhongdai]
MSHIHGRVYGQVRDGCRRRSTSYLGTVIALFSRRIVWLMGSRITKERVLDARLIAVTRLIMSLVIKGQLNINVLACNSNYFGYTQGNESRSAPLSVRQYQPVVTDVHAGVGVTAYIPAFW